MGINRSAPDFVRTDSDDDEFIMADVHKNTSFVEGNFFLIYKDEWKHNKTLIVC